jgi:sortase A
MKGKVVTILLVLVMVAGVTVALYPLVSDYWNSVHQSRVVADYNKMISSHDAQDFTSYFEAADAYNQTLLTTATPFDIDNWTDAQKAEYNNLLSVDGNQVMATLDIPKINVWLPVYHGTDESVLQVGIGHIQGSSLPVGGESTHSVLSGHTGLPSAQLLTDLDQIVIGDLFSVTVLDRTLTYQVDQILVVEPDDISALAIVPGEDYVTLVTCTPYGINSHRLLVRGTRVYPAEQEAVVVLTGDAQTVNPWLAVAVFGAPVFLLGFVVYLVFRKRKHRIK